MPHPHCRQFQSKMTDWRVVSQFLAGVSLVLFPASFAQPRPPTLAKRLQENYTIDPTLLPLFTKCAFDGEPAPTISWMLNSILLPTESQEPQSGPFYSSTQGTLNLGKATISDSGNYTCVATNIVGRTSVSVNITIVRGPQAIPIWIRWWMIFLYAFGVWLLCTVCLVAYFIYRRCTTKTERKRPRRVKAANTEEYVCYDDEVDSSPRYNFTNQHADSEGLPTTFNAQFQDQPSHEATGYLNPAFQSNTMYYAGN